MVKLPEEPDETTSDIRSQVASLMGRLLHRGRPRGRVTMQDAFEAIDGVEVSTDENPDGTRVIELSFDDNEETERVLSGF